MQIYVHVCSRQFDTQRFIPKMLILNSPQLCWRNLDSIQKNLVETYTDISVILRSCRVSVSSHLYFNQDHYCDVIMVRWRLKSPPNCYSTVHSGADKRKHQSSASPAVVRGIHWSPVNSPHIWLVTPTMFPFDDVIMMAMTSQREHSL